MLQYCEMEHHIVTNSEFSDSVSANLDYQPTHHSIQSVPRS